MKITIDTKEDSSVEIKKAIELLSALIQHKAKSSNLFEEDSPSSEPAGNAFTNLFGNTEGEKKTEKEKAEEEDMPELIPY